MSNARVGSPTSSVEHILRMQSTAPSREQFPEQEVTFLDPNAWWRVRKYIREPAAEFAGAMLLFIFGCGVNCQVNLSGNTGASSPKGDYTSICLGWAAGIALGVWRKVPATRGIVGAGVGYANYFHAIDIVEGGHGIRTLATASNFGPFAASRFKTSTEENPYILLIQAAYETNVSAFFDEFFITAILLIRHTRRYG
ncbi:hypothetical protein D9757_000974 [Collybiopsis confluens]|uniref:Uncharacterized protein n=1 Tax=Collybiopsis confluens TaxID=2823264 RepID=A0A8H5MGC0_9AGAR|nr:hypothetical protein D9757_000974 [Collybiopsis confluens]